MQATENWKNQTEAFINNQKKRQMKSWDFLIKKIMPDIALLQEVLYESIPQIYLNRNVFFTESRTSKLYNGKLKWGTAIYANPNINAKENTSEYFNDEDIGESGKIISIEVEIMEIKMIFINIHIDTYLPDDGNYSIGINQLKKIFENKKIHLDNLIIGGDLNCDRNTIYNGIDFNRDFFTPLFGENEFVIYENSKFIECVPFYRQTFFRKQITDKNPIQDDHLFVSKKIFGSVVSPYKKYSDYKLFNHTYGATQEYSDHSIISIEFRDGLKNQFVCTI